jgi:hypothetical protein
MPWTHAAAATAKKIALSPTGRKVAQQAAAAASRRVASGDWSTVTNWQDTRRQRDLAHRFARQVHGRLSEAVFLGSRDKHLVVWKDGVPLAAFPPVEGDLAARPELRHVTEEDRFDPRPAQRPPVRERLPRLPGRGHADG